MPVLDVTFGLEADGTTITSNIPVSNDYVFYATGGFGGGTVSLEASPDRGVTWLTVEQLSNNGRLVRYLGAGEIVRMSLTDSTDPDVTTGIRF